MIAQELAERRSRQNVADRHMIADRTAKSLRLLATPVRVYRDRSLGRASLHRRSVNLTDYLTSPPEEMDMEDEEGDYGNVLEATEDSPPSFIEGARVASDLYDAYSNHAWSRPMASLTSRNSLPHP